MEKNKYIFTQQHTRAAKGAAIILMVIHHLFRVPERIQNVSYISICPLLNFNFEFWLADFGKICVAMYLFLSGYGLYIVYMKKDSFHFKDSLIRVIRFLINYWVIFIIFIPIGLYWFNNNPRYYWNLKVFVENFFLLSNTYSGEWWFIRLYLELVLIFPVVKFVIKRSTVISFFISLSLYFISIYPKLLSIILLQMLQIKSDLIVTDINNILYWQIVFCIGAIFAKGNFFEVIHSFFTKKNIDCKYVSFAGIILIMIIRIVVSRAFILIGRPYSTYIDFILAPLLIFFFTNIIYVSKLKNIFLVLGENSTNIWLIHTFFAYHYCQKLVFFPKVSVLIVIWLLILSLACSIIINFIISKIYRLGEIVRTIGDNKRIYKT